ncbi:MAG: ADP-glyceromanno-heptose 6-epimerase [Sphingobacteriales bacterium]|nr:ADP-glyceromanno-heptose 6-epimerase [Sphingobacteriales bacterium]
MDRNSVILLTGAAGFIGSYLLGYLNQEGYEQIIIVDDFSREDKKPNYGSKKFLRQVERDQLFNWLKPGGTKIDFVFHLGARTDTTEFDYRIHEKLNLEYSKKIWQYCTEKNIPLVYASSAATYGAGELGYKDDHGIVVQLKPLNPYGVSKNEFDKWALSAAAGGQQLAPPSWQGLKFFNVYGPNEYHKARMASVIFHSSNQIRSTGKVKLFKSHRPGYRDGQQLRDFIYVKDVAKVCVWLMQHKVASGLYNLGTGRARSFEDLAKATFAGMGVEPVIEYIDMPEDIRDKYQYFTEADMQKLKATGYTEPFTSLEEGVGDYVKNFLKDRHYY